MSLSEADKETIVDAHNECRRKIAEGNISNQPKAKNMTYLEWDEELGRLAQSWANRRQFQHNPGRKHSQFSVGENIYMSFTSNHSDKGINWKDAVDSWFNEYKKYRYSPIGNVSGTGHYTQVVWADTKYIGCGASQYISNGMLSKLIVCNYGPAGNYMGQYPYKI